MRTMLLGVDARSEKVTGCAHEGVVNQVSPFSLRYCRSPRPMSESIPLLLVFSLLLLGAVCLLVVGLWKKRLAIFHVVLLLAVFVSCALRITFYSFWTIPIGESFTSFTGSSEKFAVSIEAANIMERLGGVFFTALFAIFTYILLSASLATFFPDRKKLLIILTIIGAALLVLSTGYCVAIVAVANVLVTNENIIDFGRILLASLSVLFCTALICTWILVLVSTRENAQFESHKKRTVIFLIASSLLLVGFVLTLVFACLYTFVQVAQWAKPYFFTLAVAEFLSGLAILSYVFIAVRAKVVGDKSGYSSMVDDEHEEEDSVPLLYAEY